ncbi:hypothetical protein [Nocardia miyunensis]|uniref:hypothetical protein n=1 Tax=Nocardia miyunensis TaxID=282684 RepID=UPI0008311F6A|nr:hypothetical protein [Nocardia miyunensis]
MPPTPEIGVDYNADLPEPRRFAQFLPTVCELREAMDGRVPADHPARLFLLAARLLTTVPDWINCDRFVVAGDDGNEIAYGSEVLADIGIADITDPVRTAIIDRINHAAKGCWFDNRVGHMIDAIARACWELRRATAAHLPGSPGHTVWIARARHRVVAAQRDYRMLVRGRTWVIGPDPEPDGHGDFFSSPVSR